MRIHTFGTGQDLPVEDAVARLGRKGAGLLEMARLGIPVPPGFTITTEVCNYFSDHGDYPAGVDVQLEAALAACAPPTSAEVASASATATAPEGNEDTAAFAAAMAVLAACEQRSRAALDT
jgi:pyruvate,orthophosphate dikinase